jgi:NAD(P)-dependent dehydrogenase (short-subunit alcohol dehydrogenase family)
MKPRLADKKILVTGATSNIGLAIAVRSAEAGAHVVVSGRDRERGTRTVEGIRARGGRADFVAAELDGSRAAAIDLADRATDMLGGRLNVLVNSAGIFPSASTVDTDEAAFDEVYAINVKAPFFLTAAVAPAMIARGEGSIVNISSWVTRLAVPGAPSYAASKGAIEALTKTWAAELGPLGVRVNAISPGVIQSADPGGTLKAYMRGTPAGDIGHPDAVAYAAVYLASDEAHFLHGSIIDVDGGRTSAAVFA